MNFKFSSLTNCLKKLILILLFFISIYKILYFTLLYLEFRTTIRMEIMSQTRIFPSITLCVKSNSQLSQIKKHKNINESLNDYIYRSIECRIKSVSGEWYKCQEVSTVYRSITPFSKSCYTFLSFKSETDKMYELFSKIDIKIMNNIEMIVLLHPRRTPPHLIKEFIALKANKFYGIGFKAIRESLLEYPYETNCFDYDRYSLSPNKETNLPQSADECVVNYIQRSELRECGCNKNWFFDKFDAGNRSCENSNMSCDYDYNRYLYRMKIVCRQNCFIEFYATSLEVSSGLIEKNYTNLIIRNSNDFNLMLVFIPDMFFSKYLFLTGGMVSILIALYIHYPSIYLDRKIVKCLFKMSRKFKSRCISLTKNIILFIIRVKLFFLRLICLLFLLSQVMQLLGVYLEDKELSSRFTRVELKQQISLPKILINIKPDFDKNKMIEIYPEFKSLYNEWLNDKNDTEVLFNRYYIKYLSENSVTKFNSTFLNLNEVIKFCHLVINRKEIKCPKPAYGIRIYGKGRIFLTISYFADLTNAEKELLVYSGIKDHFEKVVIELNNTLEFSFGIYKSQIGDRKANMFELSSNSNVDLFYSSFMWKKFYSDPSLCQYNNEISFENDSNDKRIIDCILYEYNKTFNCLPLWLNDVWILFGTNSRSFEYRFCPFEKVIDKSMKAHIMEICVRSHEQECNEKFFETNLKINSGKSKSMIKIIPKLLIQPQYIESLVSNFKELYYESGGIVGFWLGVIAIWISGLNSNFENTLRKVLNLINCKTSKVNPNLNTRKKV